MALAFELAVTLIVASTGHLSGAHVNPSVTVGLWSVRRFPGREVLPYVVAQCVGAVLASQTLRWLLGPVGGLGATAHWLYWVAPTLGMVLAVRLYDALRDTEAPSLPRDVDFGVEGPIASTVSRD